jgi:hypothetical protein
MKLAEGKNDACNETPRAQSVDGSMAGRVSEGTTNFRTTDLPLAAYLHSTRGLPFVGCEADRNGRVAFVFDDPSADGERLRIDFESGALCAAAAFYGSVRHLRRVMDGSRLLANRRTNEHASKEHFHNHIQPFR